MSDSIPDIKHATNTELESPKNISKSAFATTEEDPPGRGVSIKGYLSGVGHRESNVPVLRNSNQNYNRRIFCHSAVGNTPLKIKVDRKQKPHALQIQQIDTRAKVSTTHSDP